LRFPEWLKQVEPEAEVQRGHETVFFDGAVVPLPTEWIE